MRTGEYMQLAVFRGMAVHACEYDDLDRALRAHLGLCRPVRIVGTVVTLPCGRHIGGRCDLFVLIHREDMPRVNDRMRRLLEMCWWEDVVDRNCDSVYPPSFRRAYPALVW